MQIRGALRILHLCSQTDLSSKPRMSAELSESECVQRGGCAEDRISPAEGCVNGENQLSQVLAGGKHILRKLPFSPRLWDQASLGMARLGLP